jgi:hypothetical protein
MQTNPGDEIMIRVDGVEYKTIIDDHGTQRFPEDPDNPVLQSLPTITMQTPRGWITMPDMNELARRYHRKEITTLQYAEAVMARGYSVCGFAEHSAFDDMLIENPLWDSTEDNKWSNHTDSYLTRKLTKGSMRLSEVLEIIAERDGLTALEAERHFVEYYVMP